MLINPMHRDSGVRADKSLPDDASILAAVRSGDKQQFQILIDSHKEGLFRYFVYQVGNAHVAEDLAQDVFLSVFKAATAGSYTGQASVRTWMFSIALNRLRDFWRTSQRNRETVASALPDLQMESFASSVSGPEDQVATSDWHEKVLRVVSELPPEQKQVIYLKFFGGLTMAEVSEVTAAPLTTVKARLRYALSKLADRLASDLRGGQ